ncbi:MAG: response regulator, partial [Smithellaceae bacterium]
MNQSDQQSILIRQPQILCVEGDAAGLALLEAVFTPRGYGVVPAGTGLQALEILSKQSVDLILMDAILPGTDGFTICARIRD